MSSSIAETFVDITVNIRPLVAGLSAARSALAAWATGLKARMAALAKTLFSPLKQAFDRLRSMWAGGLLAGGAAVVGGFGYAIKKASDLNETISAVEVTFGAAAGKVKAGANEMARAFGIPKQEFLDGAMGIGAIGKAAGQTQGEAADLGVQFMKLAIDLSSMRNLPLEVALEKIRSGLVGEAEPLRAVGVLLSEAAVKQEALRMGLVRGKQELDESQKVMARASLITKQLADANGDLARTSGSFANQIRGIGGHLQNLAVDIGQSLLPAAQQFNAELLSMIRDLQAGVERNKSVFDSWGQSLRQVAVWFGVVYRNGSKFRQLAGETFKDLGKYLVDAFKSVFDYLSKWADYLGSVIRTAIEDAIDAAFKGTPLDRNKGVKTLAGPLARLLGGAQAEAIVGDVVDAQHADRRANPPKPPVFKPPVWQDNPQAEALKAQIRKAETARAIGAMAAQGIGTLRERATKFVAKYGNRMLVDRAMEQSALANAALQRNVKLGHQERIFSPRRVLSPEEQAAMEERAEANRATREAGHIGPQGKRTEPLPVTVRDRQKRREEQVERALGPIASLRKKLVEDLFWAEHKAQSGDKEAVKARDKAKKELKQFDQEHKDMMKFDIERFSPTEWHKRIQDSFFGKGQKDPNATTAENTTQMLAQMEDLNKNVKGLNKLGVAVGPE